jgi:hypothetical protein
MWKPSTVADIQAWIAGTYVPNPTDEEYWKQFLARARRLTPTRCMVPPNHPSRQEERKR